ncbi:hypothetical protein GCM10017710_49080 [Arthrobacter ramosus]
MPQVLGRLDAHVHQDLMERHVSAFFRPPRHFPGSVEWERLDGCIAVLGREPVQFDDLVPALFRGNPQVRVGFGIVGEPR